jgi:very-short-patch-repair endonuclease
MATVSVPSRDRKAWALARRDHNVVSHDELVNLGFSVSAIRHRLRKGRLHRKARGVYAVGTPNLTRFGRWMVAIKSCGKRAILSHVSAAVLWGIRKKEDRKIHVTVPRHANPRRAGITVHRRTLRRSKRHHGIPVTTVVQTLIDLAATSDRAQVERDINQADALNLLRADVLREEAARAKGEPGAKLIVDVLDRDTFALTDSELERLFLPIARAAGLPKPETQIEVNGWRVDFYFRELDWVVEADSFRYHRTSLQQRRDRERDQAHDDADTAWSRFTHHQIGHEPARVAAHLRRKAERLRRRARTPGRPRAA